MKMQPWQFSLRSLLVLMTLFAAVVALASHFPRLVIVCFLFSLPFVVGRAVASLVVYAPLVTRFLMAAVGSVYLAGAVYAFVRAGQDHELREVGFWVAFLMSLAMGLFSYWVVWALGGKQRQQIMQGDNAKAER